jgi:four helix bundle protein
VCSSSKSRQIFQARAVRHALHAHARHLQGSRRLEAGDGPRLEHCYRVSKRFPRDERFGLTSQLRRAAISIPSNVAEGHCRRKTRVYAHHVSIALGSHGELETLVELAGRLEYLVKQERRGLDERCASVGRLLSGLFRSLEEKIARGDARQSS